MDPHLDTVMDGPLVALEKKIIEATPSIERWFRLKWQDHTPPFYCSVDLRNAGFKLAPVDTNLFPGGFNNLSAEMSPLAVQATMAAIDKYCPDARNLLLIPENHTRNTHYLENLSRLIQIMRMAGLQVRLGSLLPDLPEHATIRFPDNTEYAVEPLARIHNNRRVGLTDFNPCTILLNNDLSAGTPDILANVYEQVLVPPLHAGWSVRRKSNHFTQYDEVARQFARLIEIDPWTINPFFSQCSHVDFAAREGEECLAASVHTVLTKIRRKYKEYGIKEKPFVIVKADAGTYGMGVMTVTDASEITGLNRKKRNKMSVGKEGLTVRDVIIQEGVHSFERVDNAVAEPVVYMIDRYVVGGFYRVHDTRGVTENLNAPGAHFSPLPFSHAHALPDKTAEPGTTVPNRIYMYGIIARLALLAASIEMERTDPDT
ncbi:MAG: glutamate--cysteine ligase [Burkholderiaceae bacterium]|jgi:glutamate--cysteine ligase|nr:glutamate--cysteine ligase [Burkholderiaceae bacterium]